MTSGGRRHILVTGARGYVGGRLCRAIAARADLALTGTSRRSEPPVGWPDGRFLPLAPAGGRIELPDDRQPVDTIIHLAGINQAQCRNDPQGALAAATGMAIGLLQAAANRVRRFIYVSTAHVYGGPLVGHIDEDRVPRPIHPYAIIHRTCEDFVLAERGKLQAVVVRLSNGIGAPAWPAIDDWSTVGNDLCRQAATTGCLRLASSGEQWRDFVTLGEVAAALLHLADLPADQLGEGMFNLGGSRPMRIIDVAELIAGRCQALFGHRPPILRPPILRTDTPPAPPIDYRIDRLIDSGFRPAGDLEAEIDATLRLCREAFTAPRPLAE